MTVEALYKETLDIFNRLPPEKQELAEGIKEHAQWTLELRDPLDIEEAERNLERIKQIRDATADQQI